MWLNGESVSKTQVVEKILWILTNRFDYMVATNEELKDLSAMIIYDI